MEMYPTSCNFQLRMNFLLQPQRKPKIATSLWLKAITGERINPCTLSSSRVGDCVYWCQRQKFLWPTIWSLAALQKETLHHFLFVRSNYCNYCCYASGSHQVGKAPQLGLGYGHTLLLAGLMCRSPSDKVLLGDPSKEANLYYRPEHQGDSVLCQQL